MEETNHSDRARADTPQRLSVEQSARERSRSTGTEKSRITPDVYKDNIIFHAEKQTICKTLYPGNVYSDLAKFLKRSPSNNHDLEDSKNPFATLFVVDKSTCSRGGHLDFTPFSEPSRCMEVVEEHQIAHQPQVLFFRGHPSPEWITVIGSFCKIDPEYFRWNLRFLNYREYFSSPSLPSTFSNIIRLRFVTIVCNEKITDDPSDQAAIDTLRGKGEHGMKEYRRIINNGLRTGDSLVRDYYVLDEKYSSIEQEITVSLNDVGKTWIIMVSIDAGDDLSKGPSGPWLSEEDLEAKNPWSPFLPTVQHRTRVALRPRKNHDGSGGHTKISRHRFPQSASLLAEELGLTLDTAIMAMDPFYAITELFKFSASSEMQFLNMIEAKIRPEEGYASLKQKDPTLANLLYFQDILRDHIKRLKVNLAVIESRANFPSFVATSSDTIPVRPQLSSIQLDKAKLAREELEKDYRYLIELAETLAKRCSQGMGVIINDSMLTESRRAITQAKRVEKVTFLAFFYIPFSFTTSFFGMNFQEFGTGKQSLWVFFTSSVPLFLFTLCFLLFEAQKMKKLGHRMYTWATGKLKRRQSGDDLDMT